MKSRFFRLLASSDLALALIGGLLLMAVAGGTLPQSGRLSTQELTDWYNAWPVVSVWLERTGFADVYASKLFFSLYAALLVNLAAGIVVHVAYQLAWFRGNSSARTLFLSVLPLSLRSLPESGPNGRRYGSWGLAGLPLLHAGVIVIIAAAYINSSDRLGAHFELAAGEVLAGAKGKLLLEQGSRQPDGDMGFRLRLDALQVEMENGHYRELQAKVSLQQAGGPLRHETLWVNHPLRVGPYQIFLDKNVGQTAQFERILPDGQRRSLLINFKVAREFWGTNKPLTRDETMLFEETPVLFRMILTPGNEPRLRLQAEHRGNPVFDGILAPGETADLGVYKLVFIGTLPWAGLYLSSDQALPWVFAGFILALAGFALHLLFRPRRLRLRRDGDGWRLEAWVMRDDWRFERQWREWERGA